MEDFGVVSGIRMIKSAYLPIDDRGWIVSPTEYVSKPICIKRMAKAFTINPDLPAPAKNILSALHLTQFDREQTAISFAAIIPNRQIKIKHKPHEPQWEDRDRFVLSKEHAALTCQICHIQEGNHAVKTVWGFLAVCLPLPEDKQWPKIGLRYYKLAKYSILPAILPKDWK